MNRLLNPCEQVELNRPASGEIRTAIGDGVAGTQPVYRNADATDVVKKDDGRPYVCVILPTLCGAGCGHCLGG